MNSSRTRGYDKAVHFYDAKANSAQEPATPVAPHVMNLKGFGVAVCKLWD